MIRLIPGITFPPYLLYRSTTKLIYCMNSIILFFQAMCIIWWKFGLLVGDFSIQHMRFDTCLEILLMYECVIFQRSIINPVFRQFTGHQSSLGQAFPYACDGQIQRHGYNPYWQGRVWHLCEKPECASHAKQGKNM